MGGVCAFSNPEPIAPFMDFVVVGEGEELVVELIAAYRAGYQRSRELPRPRSRRSTACTCPSATTIVYAADGTVADVRRARRRAGAS